FKYAGPLISSGFWIFKLATDTRSAASLEEVKGFKTAVVRGDGLAAYLESKGFREGKELVYTNDVNESLLITLDGKAEALPLTEDSIKYQLGVMERSTDLVAKLFRLEEIPGELWAAFNKETPDEFVARVQATIESMKRSGEYEAIIKSLKY
ncbi:MAG TPA: transporter substrate-binding domain-containing protein, partial [Rectinemataceae bacterium]|nr:transporter substrate-binding domain-containing protein [Rectinemataceae bacterium]